jgi:hypothetical protein
VVGRKIVPRRLQRLLETYQAAGSFFSSMGEYAEVRHGKFKKEEMK